MTATLTEPQQTEEPSESVRKLLERLQRQPDFPALQSAVTKVQRVARNDLAKVQTLAEAVLGDPGFSHRLLRLINAAHYRSAGGGSISSMQRAIAVMGFRCVQELALGVRLLDKLPHDRGGRLLREDFLRALVAGRLAREMCRETRGLEEAYMTALFQNFGRMLASAHLPADALAVREAVPRTEWPLSSMEQQASTRQLGLSYAELGAQIARTWGWPEPLRAAMRRDDWPLHASNDRGETLRWLGLLANDLADLLIYVDPALWRTSCEALAGRAGAATGQGADDMLAALARTREQLEELAGNVGLPLSQLQEWHRTDVTEGRDGATAAEVGREANQGSPGAAAGGPQGPPTGGKNGTSLTSRTSRTGGLTDALPRSLPAPSRGAGRMTPEGHELMAEQSLVLSDALLEDRSRAEVPGRALAALWQGLGARRAVLFLRGAGRSHYAPTQLLGAPLPPAPGPAWSIDPVAGQDLFSRLCARGADTLIEDARQPEIARHLPSGFQDGVNARHFLVLPMTVRGRPVGMIYIDREDAQPFVVDDRAIRLARTLRNQAAIALS